VRKGVSLAAENFGGERSNEFLSNNIHGGNDSVPPSDSKRGQEHKFGSAVDRELNQKAD